MNKENPSQEWLRIAAEARSQMGMPPPDEPASPWFIDRALAERRAARARASAAVPWFAFPSLARAATASALLAVVCVVLVFSTGGLRAFADPLFPELEELDLP